MLHESEGVEDFAIRENGTTEKSEANGEVLSVDTSSREDVTVDKCALSILVIQNPKDVLSMKSSTVKDKMDHLKLYISATNKCDNEVKNTLLFLLLNGPMLLKRNLSIYSSEAVMPFLEVVLICPYSDQVDLWTTFLQIVQGNKINLVPCTEANVAPFILDLLSSPNVIVHRRDLVLVWMQLLRVLLHYSVSGSLLTRFYAMLKVSPEGTWSPFAMDLLGTLSQSPVPLPATEEYFHFPGKPTNSFHLAPMSKFPSQSDWSFTVWCNLDESMGGADLDARPCLYCFRTAKGVGFTCNFVNNSLSFTVVKPNGRTFQANMPFHFLSARWYMVTVVYEYNLLSKSEIHCYVDGQLVGLLPLSWAVRSNELFNKCSIGSSPEENPESSSFAGQMSYIAGFLGMLSSQQVGALFNLGPGYKGQLNPENETLPTCLTGEGNVHPNLMFLYNPFSCNMPLCLNQAPKSVTSVFQHSSHALLTGGVKPVFLQPVYKTLQTLGGIEALFPLFAQLDAALPEDSSPPAEPLSALLFSLTSELLQSTPILKQQFRQARGFLILRQHLECASPEHVNEALATKVLSMASELLKTYFTIPGAAELLVQLFDHLLLSPTLWCRASSEVQCRLYGYLSQEFVHTTSFLRGMRQVTSVIICLHALRTHYKLPETEHLTDQDEGLASVRKSVLIFVKKLILLEHDGTATNVVLKEHLEAVLNHLALGLDKDVMVCDVLHLVMELLHEVPQFVVPWFQEVRGEQVIFKLLTSQKEKVRLHALKVLALFLTHSTEKRKSETMLKCNLFSLLTEKLLLHTSHLSMPVYNVLFETLTERTGLVFFHERHLDIDDSFRIENSSLLKVIADLLCRSQLCPESRRVLMQFLHDLYALCTNNGQQNMHTLLQLTVWQDWLLSLCPLSEDVDTLEVRDAVVKVLVELLHHALKVECGGWRVWVDTVAMLHSRVAREAFLQGRTLQSQVSKGEDKSSKSVKEWIRQDIIEPLVDAALGGVQTEDSEEPPTTPQDGIFPLSTSASNAPYRIPDFQWSPLHLHILHELFLRIEQDLHIWSPEQQSVLFCTVSPDQLTYMVNVTQVIAQMTDIMLMSTGGLLPLLAAATSVTGEMENNDQGTNTGLQPNLAFSFLMRVVRISDVVVLSTRLPLRELEQEKYLLDGGVLRIILRLVLICAVRNCLECRYSRSTDLTDLAYRVVDGTFLRQLQQLEVTETENPHAGDGNAIADSEADKISLKSVDLKKLYSMIELVIPRALTEQLTQDQLRQSPIRDALFLLQEHDLRRLEQLLVRETENLANKEYLALLMMYFLSVLMVSRYRDILDPQDRRNSSDEGSESVPDIVSSGGSMALLTQRMNASLAPVALLWKNLFQEHSNYLSKQLIGSHGQQLTSSLCSLKQSTSAVELVMLLCSQEWQNSLQTHAGTAFMHMVQEGQRLAKTQCEYIVRVATEADFIVNRQRAEDVSRHTEFEKTCHQREEQIAKEERLCSHLLEASRQRDKDYVHRRMHRIRAALEAPHAPWALDLSHEQPGLEAFRLDVWEDDSRRRQRFIRDLPMESTENPSSEVASHISLDSLQGAWPEHLLRVLNSSTSTYADMETHGIADEDLVVKPPESAPAPHPTNPQPPHQPTQTPADQTKNDEVSLSTSCLLVVPGCAVQGMFYVTMKDIFFEMDPEHPANLSLDPQILLLYSNSLYGKWSFSDVRGVQARRYLQRNVALEIFMACRSAVMFAFPDPGTVRRVVALLPNVGVSSLYNLPRTRNISLAAPRQLFNLSNMTKRWQQHEVSNLDYLMYLNTIAGRTYNDLSQYPVLPWVVADYQSEEFALHRPESYRDLSKPIGALNPTKRSLLEEQYLEQTREARQVQQQAKHLPQQQTFASPAFHQLKFPLTQATVLRYLQLVKPFKTLNQRLISPEKTIIDANKKPVPVADLWTTCCRGDPVGELVPEFYYLPDIFLNPEDGKLAVQLPRWASTPEEFVRTNRQALESEIVSGQLHEWIDLIFGYKQRGPEAVRVLNVFCPLAYQSGVDWSKASDSSTLRQLQDLLLQTGQVPSQLLTQPHPPRNQIFHSALHRSLSSQGSGSGEMCLMMKFPSNSPILHLAAVTHPSLSSGACVVAVMANRGYSLNKWHQPQMPASAKPSGPAEAPGSQGRPRGSKTATIPTSNTPTEPAPPTLPLSMDPLYVHSGALTKQRFLGENFDQNMAPRSAHFAVTADGKVMFVCGYWDRSLKAIATATNQVLQSVIGHQGVVTCVARSESGLIQDCFVVSGGQEGVVLLWLWSVSKNRFESTDNQSDFIATSALPIAVMTGHSTEVSCVSVSAELGLVFSCSAGRLLLHTTDGDLIRSLSLVTTTAIPTSPPKLPHLQMTTHQRIFFTREGYFIVQASPTQILLYSLSGRLFREVSPLADGMKSAASVSDSPLVQENNSLSVDSIQSTLLTRSGGFLLVGSQQGRVLVLRCATLAMVHEFNRCDAPVRSLALTHDQKYLLAGLETGSIVVFHIDFSQWLPEYKNRNPQG